MYSFLKKTIINFDVDLGVHGYFSGTVLLSSMSCIIWLLGAQFGQVGMIYMCSAMHDPTTLM